MGYQKNSTKAQRAVLGRDLGYDDGGRFSLIAVSGYEISDGYDTFGTLFSIIDCDTGDEVEQSPVVSPAEVTAERRRMIGRVMHLNGREDVYAA